MPDRHITVTVSEEVTDAEYASLANAFATFSQVTPLITEIVTDGGTTAATLNDAYSRVPAWDDDRVAVAPVDARELTDGETSDG